MKTVLFSALLLCVALVCAGHGDGENDGDRRTGDSPSEFFKWFMTKFWKNRHGPRKGQSKGGAGQKLSNKSYGNKPQWRDESQNRESSQLGDYDRDDMQGEGREWYVTMDHFRTMMKMFANEEDSKWNSEQSRRWEGISKWDGSMDESDWEEWMMLCKLMNRLKMMMQMFGAGKDGSGMTEWQRHESHREDHYDEDDHDNEEEEEEKEDDYDEYDDYDGYTDDFDKYRWGGEDEEDDWRRYDEMKMWKEMKRGPMGLRKMLQMFGKGKEDKSEWQTETNWWKEKMRQWGGETDRYPEKSWMRYGAINLFKKMMEIMGRMDDDEGQWWGEINSRWESEQWPGRMNQPGYDQDVMEGGLKHYKANNPFKRMMEMFGYSEKSDGEKQGQWLNDKPDWMNESPMWAERMQWGGYDKYKMGASESYWAMKLFKMMMEMYRENYNSVNKWSKYDGTQRSKMPQWGGYGPSLKQRWPQRRVKSNGGMVTYNPMNYISEMMTELGGKKPDWRKPVTVQSRPTTIMTKLKQMIKSKMYNTMPQFFGYPNRYGKGRGKYGLGKMQKWKMDPSVREQEKGKQRAMGYIRKLLNKMGIGKTSVPFQIGPGVNPMTIVKMLRRMLAVQGGKSKTMSGYGGSKVFSGDGKDISDELDEEEELQETVRDLLIKVLMMLKKLTRSEQGGTNKRQGVNCEMECKKMGKCLKPRRPKMKNMMKKSHASCQNCIKQACGNNTPSPICLAKSHGKCKGLCPEVANETKSELQECIKCYDQCEASSLDNITSILRGEDEEVGSGFESTGM